MGLAGTIDHSLVIGKCGSEHLAITAFLSMVCANRIGGRTLADYLSATFVVIQEE